MIKIDTYDRSKSKDDSMTILLFQWKTVNDVTNTQRTSTVFLYKGGGIKAKKRGF